MKFTNTRVMNFEGAFRGMRNPLASWNKSDSCFDLLSEECEEDYFIAEEWARKEKPEYYENENENVDIDEKFSLEEKYVDWLANNGTLKGNFNNFVFDVAYIGPKDMELAKRLVKAGPEHRKFLRQIFVSVDIEAPRYWFEQFSTYSVGITANSTSTMHKLASTPITINCFEIDDMDNIDGMSLKIANTLIKQLEELRQKYNETRDMRYWKELVRWLPQSWKQTRTVTMNYENILSICKQRAGHKLTEWQKFIEWAKTLPYADDLIFIK